MLIWDFATQSWDGYRLLERRRGSEDINPRSWRQGDETSGARVSADYTSDALGILHELSALPLSRQHLDWTEGHDQLKEIGLWGLCVSGGWVEQSVTVIWVVADKLSFLQGTAHLEKITCFAEWLRWAKLISVSSCWDQAPRRITTLAIS